MSQAQPTAPSAEPQVGPPPEPERGERPARLARLLPVLLLAALAALPQGKALFDPEWVALAVDTATVQGPWSAAIGEVLDGEGQPVERPRNPALSDQGVGFYPFYRWVLASWRALDPPFWNPLLYLGAPGLGNPQYGVLDPQVLVLLPLELLFGLDGFHLGLAWLGWLRLFAAGLGAYLLARRLGLGVPGGLLCAVAFQSSGFVQLWLHFSLGHVTPFLPWLLYALEGCRGPRPARSAALASLCVFGAVLGGHPETAFYVGAAGGLWALGIFASDRRAGGWALFGLAAGSLLSFPSVLPFLEYLTRSGAQELRAASAAARGIPLLELAALAGSMALVCCSARARRPGGLGLALGLGAVVSLGATAFWLTARGLPETAGLALVPDLFGAPGRPGGYQGPGTHVEEASAWIPALALALAFAAAFSPGGHLRGRGLVLVLGFAAWWLALRAPGLLELKQRVPMVGLGATVRLASVSGLMLALLAGEALERAGPRERRLGAAVFLALLLVWCRADTAPEHSPNLATAAESDEWVQFVLAPAADGRSDRAVLEGWIHPDVPLERARARVVPLDAEGVPDPSREVFQVPAELAAGPSAEARAALSGASSTAPPGARWFSSRYLQTNRLTTGLWRLDLVLLGDDGAELGARRAGVITLSRPHRASRFTWLLVGASLLWLLLAPSQGSGVAAVRWAVVLLAAVQGGLFSRGLNPPIPAREAFPPTATEAILAEVLGVHRFFSDPGVLPPDTGLVRGLRALDGYDGLDVAAYNAMRPLALQPGVQALLGWNARGVDLDSPFYRLLGVGALVLGAPLEHPRLEWVAGPTPDAPRYAETYIYRDREPFPRAFVAAQVATTREVLALLEAGELDPRRMATFDRTWVPREPLREARVLAGPSISNRRVELEVELDGEGLLVVTEQYFPGWRVRVNGEPRELGRAFGLFRALPLASGRHQVEMVYAPESFRLGLWAAALGSLLLGAAWVRCGVRARRLLM